MFWKFVVPVALMSWGCYALTYSLLGPNQRETEVLQADAEAYVMKSLPIILKDFSYAEYEKRATAELLQTVTPARMKINFARYRRIFGPLREVEPPIGQLYVDEVRGTKIPTGTFLLRARFRYGYVYAGIRVVQRGGGWKYQRFTLRSERTETIK